MQINLMYCSETLGMMIQRGNMLLKVSGKVSPWNFKENVIRTGQLPI